MQALSNSESSLRRTRLALLLTLVVALLVGATSAAGQSGGTLGSDVPSGLSWGIISYYAGGGALTTLPNGALATQLSHFSATAVAIDSQGNVYLASGDVTGESIYMVYAGGAKIPPILSAVTTPPVVGGIYLVAGVDANCSSDVPNGGLSYCADASTALLATFGYIGGMAFDANDNLYLADEYAGAIRRIDYASTAVTTVVGQLNNPTAFGSTDVGDNGLATSATLFFPTDIKVDAAGNLFIADGNNEVRLVYQGGAVPPILTAEQGNGFSPGNGFIYDIAGAAQQYCAGAGACNNNGSALGISFGFISGVEVDSAGDVYVSDLGAGTIDLVYAGGSVPPLLKTATSSPAPGSIYQIAGQEFITCSTAPCGDGAPALQAQLNGPYALHADQGGNLYLADTSDYTVRKIDAAGYISVSAGTESPGGAPSASTGNGGAATAAQFQLVNGIAINARNNLYVLDQNYVWLAAPAVAQTISFPAIPAATYGDPPIVLEAVAKDSNGNPTGLPITYSVSPANLAVISSSGANLVINGAGTLQITATQAGNAQYSQAATTLTLQVNPAVLTVTANSASKITLTQNPPLSASFSGFVNGDTAQTAFTGQPALSTTATTGSSAGSYPINISIGNLAAANYTFLLVPGVLDVTGSTAQSISFAPLSPVTYGQSSTLSLVATASSGLPVQYTVNSGPGKVSGSTLTITGGGNIVITADQFGNDTYAEASPVTQSLTVQPALLTVTGPSVSLTYGVAINLSTFPPPKITGFVAGDTQDLITGSAQYTTTASGTPDAGSPFPVQVSLGSLALAPGARADYVFGSPVAGTLTITQAAQAIVFDQLNDSAYGQSVNVHAIAVDAQGNPTGSPVTVTASSTGLFNNEAFAVLSPATSTIVQMGANAAGNVTVTATQAGTKDYAPAPSVSQTINFAKAPLNVTAVSFSRETSASNPTLTYQIGCPGGAAASGCFVNNDSDIPAVVTGAPVVTTTADQSSPPGTYPLVVAQGTLAAPNYTFNLINGTLTVLPPGDYTITATPSTLTIPAGQNRQTTLTISTTNLYQGTVTLSCGQLPANVNCIFSPASFTFTGADNVAGGANAAVGTLTITTQGGQTVVGSLSTTRPQFRQAAFLMPGALATLLITVRRRKLPGYLAAWRLLLMLSLSLGAVGLVSCSSGSGGSSASSIAAPGSFTVMLSGAGTTVSGSGSVAQSVSLDVTVQ